MTTTIIIQTNEGNESRQHHITLTDEALKRARRNFNPSGDERVDAVKCLAAAFYTILQPVQEARHPIAGREAATAMTDIQGGAMFAVSALTATL